MLVVTVGSKVKGLGAQVAGLRSLASSLWPGLGGMREALTIRRGPCGLHGVWEEVRQHAASNTNS